MFEKIEFTAPVLWPIPHAIEEQFIGLGLRNFIDHVCKFGFESFPSPRFYLAKKHHDVYHFVEFRFSNSGLFFEVTISVYIDGDLSAYPAHHEDKSLCDIREAWPAFFYTPINFYLKNSMGHHHFPCYNQALLKESIAFLINEFDTIYTTDVSTIRNKQDFKRIEKVKAVRDS